MLLDSVEAFFAPAGLISANLAIAVSRVEPGGKQASAVIAALFRRPGHIYLEDVPSVDSAPGLFQNCPNFLREQIWCQAFGLLGPERETPPAGFEPATCSLGV